MDSDLEDDDVDEKKDITIAQRTELGFVLPRTRFGSNFPTLDLSYIASRNELRLVRMTTSCGCIQGNATLTVFDNHVLQSFPAP